MEICAIGLVFYLSNDYLIFFTFTSASAISSNTFSHIVRQFIACSTNGLGIHSIHSKTVPHLAAKINNTHKSIFSNEQALRLPFM
ncbi:MAG: hypothetical protein MUF75_00725 [Bacteroidia bacterium]|jgi:hypothetical protein|nr:hypothetical protein [Bacteroidia bacterium]